MDVTKQIAEVFTVEEISVSNISVFFEGISIELLCFVFLTKMFFPKLNVFLLQNCFGTNKMLHLDILKKPENVPLCFVNCENEIKIWHANIIFIQNLTYCLFLVFLYI
jgi:hypothetical protein